MTLARTLVPALWLCWIAYWAIAARGVKRTARRESLRSRLSHQLPLLGGAVLMAVPVGGVLDARFVPATPLWQWLAVALLALGLGFTVYARIWLAGNWSSEVTLKQGHELIRNGPYALVRHPIYSGLLLALFASALAVGRWRALAGLALFVAALLRKLTIEERFMADRFGAAYARYREDVAALVPFLI